MVGIAATTFPITVFSASLPEVAEEFKTTVPIIAWVIAGPFLAMALANPIAGKFGDIRGHRFSYLLGFLLAILFSFATAAAWDAGSLIFFRIVGQATGAFTGPATVAILLTSFPAHLQSKALGYWGTVTAISPALGIVVGGPLIDALSWRWVFIIEGVIVLGAFLFALFIIPDTKPKPRTPIDYSGILFLSSAVAALMLGVNRGVEWGFDHPIAITTLFVSPFLFAFFILRERRITHPFLPLGWFRQRNFTGPVLVSFFLNFAYLGAFSITPFLLERLYEFSITQRSYFLLIRPLMFALGAAIGGTFHVKLGARKITLVGTALVAFASIYMGLAAPFEFILWLVLGLIFSGFGHGVVRPSLITSLSETVSEQDLGLASGAFNTVGLLGASVGSNLMLVLVGDTSSTNTFLYVYFLAFGIGALGVLASVLIKGADSASGQKLAQSE